MAMPAFGHDIGVTEVEFLELPDHNYQLVIITQGGVDDVISSPILPKKCNLKNSKNKLKVTSEIKFNCGDEGLTAGDSIILTWNRDALLIHAKWLDNTETRTLFLREGDIITVSLSDLAAASASIPTLATRYAALGFQHILEGIDHLFFVLGIMLLVTSANALLKAITAFTVAHSITLALSFMGLLALPSAPVEASIAFSIVILAYEVIRAAKGQAGFTVRFPWVVAGGFGLLHGLGFAGALMQLGVPSGEVPIALLGFNIGVEFGQIAFVVFVLLAIHFVNLVSHKMNVALSIEQSGKLPAAYALGCIATYWSLTRGAAIFIGT